ncbi:MAG: ABC transporter permease [Cellulosilyticum sp.]|nr:ABC transporter permease [Cellulosilyticum sp.]
MKKYLSFFRLKFSMGLQYRAAALAGVITQFAWGAMKILMFCAFYKEDPSAFPMSLEATVNYVWLEQSTIALFMAWLMENEIFESIVSGNVAYELCRPINIYDMWFVRSMGNRYAKALLRCFPILFIAVCMPSPYGLTLPNNLEVWGLFSISMVMSSMVMIALCMIVYMSCFYTISSTGIRMIAMGVFEFFQGSIIPIPFFPEEMARVMEFLPFGSLQNVPFRIYSGDIKGMQILESMGVQLFWIVVLIIIGKFMCARAMRKICVQGG